MVRLNRASQLSQPIIKEGEITIKGEKTPEIEVKIGETAQWQRSKDASTVQQMQMSILTSFIV